MTAKKRSAADDNIVVRHGNHDIPDKPPGPHPPIPHHSQLSQKCLDWKAHPMNLLVVLTTMSS
jgi:hypothetical protein